MLIPVHAQASFDVNWSFDYNPLVAGITDTLHVLITNTDPEPLRLPSVTVSFSWMSADNNLSPQGGQANVELQPGQEAPYNFYVAVPENVTGSYVMGIDVIYQIFQAPNWGGLESETYVVPGLLVYGASPSAYGVSSISYDAYDGRIYSAIAVITLVGWYLPRKLRYKPKG